MEGGCRILLMRPEYAPGRLENLGKIVWIPVIRIKPRVGCSKIVLSMLPKADLVVITSPRTISVLLEDARQHGLFDELIKHLLGKAIAAVGPKTAESIKRYGLRVTLMPGVYDGEHLGEEIVTRFRGRRVLLVRSSRGVKTLTLKLQQASMEFLEVHVYDIIVDEEAALKAASMILEGTVDYAIFTSPSIAEAICDKLLGARPDTTFIAIGNTTLQTLLRKCQRPKVLVPQEYTMEAIANIIEPGCNSRRRT